MKWKFEASDFSFLDSNISMYEQAAHEANAKLDEWRRMEAVVYCRLDVEFLWSQSRADTDTHRALLIDVEELPKGPCKHEPDYTQYAIDEKYQKNQPMRCKQCGVKLKATWEAAE